MRCLSCKYDLKNLSGGEHRCPECGREFDSNDPSTFERKRVSGRHNNLVMLIALGALIVLWLLDWPRYISIRAGSIIVGAAASLWLWVFVRWCHERMFHRKH